MKYKTRIVILMVLLFLVTQLIGLYVANYYSGGDNLPYGLQPPTDISPQQNLFSIVFSIVFAVLLILILMKLRAEFFMRIWFFIVVTIALSITFNSIIYGVNYATLISFGLALVLGVLKVFKRNLFVHNITELAVYPGIAAIFIPILNVTTAVILFILISLYDMYAVWQAGFMQKMAKYQIQKVKVFGGFLIPLIHGKNIKFVENKKNSKKIKVSVAILGGGDVVFPIILAGVVLAKFGILAGLIISFTATISLLLLVLNTKKGKSYPAMPFLTIGCFVGLAAVYLLNFLHLL